MDDLLTKLLKIAPAAQLENWARQHTSNQRPHYMVKENLVRFLVASDSPALRETVISWVSRVLRETAPAEAVASSTNPALIGEVHTGEEILVDRRVGRVGGSRRS